MYVIAVTGVRWKTTSTLRVVSKTRMGGGGGGSGRGIPPHISFNSHFKHNLAIKPLSQLAHETFTTFYDRNVLASYELSHLLHEPTQLLHAFLWSYQVFSK